MRRWLQVGVGRLHARPRRLKSPLIRGQCQFQRRYICVLTMQDAAAPMTLGNMRANGVHTLAVWCEGRGCNHQLILDVSRFADDVPVPAFGPRMACTICGVIGADARPNWQERAPPNLFGPAQRSLGHVLINRWQKRRCGCAD
jgi:hypothetical protein